VSTGTSTADTVDKDLEDRPPDGREPRLWMRVSTVEHVDLDRPHHAVIRDGRCS